MIYFFTALHYFIHLSSNLSNVGNACTGAVTRSVRCRNDGRVVVAAASHCREYTVV